MTQAKQCGKCGVRLVKSLETVKIRKQLYKDWGKVEAALKVEGASRVAAMIDHYAPGFTRWLQCSGYGNSAELIDYFAHLSR